MPLDRARPASRRVDVRRGGDRGAAAVEFALVVPVLLLVVFGTIQYGFYFWAMQGGSDITRSAARLAAVSDPAGCTEFRALVSAQVGAFAASQGDVAITRSYTNGPGNSAPAVEVGDLVTVTVAFDSTDLGLSGLVPFIDDGRVTQSAQARVDYVTGVPGGCA